MAQGVVWILVIVTVIYITLDKTAAQGGDCTHKYVRQPGGVMCNPFAFDYPSDLVLRCELVIPEADLSFAVIHWFNGNQRITSGVSEIRTSVVFSNVSSTVTLSNLNENDRTEITCRLVLGNRNWFSSDPLVLGTSLDYIQYSECTLDTVYYIESEKCAANPTPTTLPPTTVTPASPTTDEVSPNSLSSSSTVIPDNPTTSQPSPLHTPTPSPSRPPSTDSQTSTSDENLSKVSRHKNEHGTNPLQPWIYVLVSLTASFAFIIILLTILLLRMCLIVQQLKHAETETASNHEHRDFYKPIDTLDINKVYDDVLAFPGNNSHCDETNAAKVNSGPKDQCKPHSSEYENVEHAQGNQTNGASENVTDSSKEIAPSHLYSPEYEDPDQTVMDNTNLLGRQYAKVHRSGMVLATSTGGHECVTTTVAHYGTENIHSSSEYENPDQAPVSNKSVMPDRQYAKVHRPGKAQANIMHKTPEHNHSAADTEKPATHSSEYEDPSQAPVNERVMGQQYARVHRCVTTVVNKRSRKENSSNSRMASSVYSLGTPDEHC